MSENLETARRIYNQLVSIDQDAIGEPVKIAPEEINDRLVLDAMLAYRFLDIRGNYVRPNLVDRTWRIYQLTEKTDLQKAEYDALNGIEIVHAYQELFGHGDPHLSTPYNATGEREIKLARYGFGTLRLPLEASKVRIGVARQRAEANPTVEAWRTTQRHTVEAQVAALAADVAAKTAVDAETKAAKRRKGFRPFLRSMSQGESVRDKVYIEDEGEGLWLPKDQYLGPFIVKYMRNEAAKTTEDNKLT